MQLAVVKETQSAERRVAMVPEDVKKYTTMGLDVLVQQGAGLAAGINDEAYYQAGAILKPDFKSTVQSADIVLKIQIPHEKEEIQHLKKGALLVGIFSPLTQKKAIEDFAKLGISAISMDMVPRITRAQSMDVLSSQSNLAGYRAVLDAVYEFDKAMPMMMTAAGTIAPAKVLILGAGVAGLQAIATAKRLGAVVSAFDVRPAVKEQVQSLGATFIEVEADENLETAGGYAKEVSEDYKQKQAAKIKEAISKSDIVITTALIPGRPAPLLIPADFVDTMKPGSIIVDMAVESGGNCALSKPGEIVTHKGVKIIGHCNIASRLPRDASALLSRNYYNLVKLIYDTPQKAVNLNFDDEIIKASTLTHQGEIVHEQLR